MATTEPLRVELTGLQPFKTFVGKVARADALMRTMSVEEAKALPTCAVRAIMLLQEAMAGLAPADGAQAPVAEEHTELDDATIDRLFPDGVEVPVDPGEDVNKYSLVRATLRTLGAAGYTLSRAGGGRD